MFLLRWKALCFGIHLSSSSSCSSLLHYGLTDLVWRNCILEFIVDAKMRGMDTIKLFSRMAMTSVEFNIMLRPTLRCGSLQAKYGKKLLRWTVHSWTLIVKHNKALLKLAHAQGYTRMHIRDIHDTEDSFEMPMRFQRKHAFFMLMYVHFVPGLTKRIWCFLSLREISSVNQMSRFGQLKVGEILDRAKEDIPIPNFLHSN